MTADEVLKALHERGAELTADGDQLRYRATKTAIGPELRQAIASHKAELLSRLTTAPAKEPPPPDQIGEPCPDCGAAEWWIWLDGRRLCRPCLIRGGPPTEGSA
jgi:hypothetical protein